VKQQLSSHAVNVGFKAQAAILHPAIVQLLNGSICCISGAVIHPSTFGAAFTPKVIFQNIAVLGSYIAKFISFCPEVGA